MGTYKKTMEGGGQYILRCDSDKETGRDISFVILDDVLYNIIGIAEHYERISVPKGVRVMKSKAVIGLSCDDIPVGMECREFHIPASVELIEPNVFPLFPDMMIHSITLDPKNKAYRLINGLLYSSDGKKLVQFPSDAEEETHVVRIPEGTVEIEKGALPWFEKIIIPDSVTKFGDLSKLIAEWGTFCAVVGPGSAAEKYCRKNDIPFE